MFLGSQILHSFFVLLTKFEAQQIASHRQGKFFFPITQDSAEDAYKELPYGAFAQAVFALIYAHKKVGIIPDSVLRMGRADDSSIVRAVLIQNERAFALYAAAQDRDWSQITSQP